MFTNCGFVIRVRKHEMQILKYSESRPQQNLHRQLYYMLEKYMYFVSYFNKIHYVSKEDATKCLIKLKLSLWYLLKSNNSCNMLHVIRRFYCSVQHRYSSTKFAVRYADPVTKKQRIKLLGDFVICDFSAICYALILSLLGTYYRLQ